MEMFSAVLQPALPSTTHGPEKFFFELWFSMFAAAV
jgi:hypothetical protein